MIFVPLPFVVALLLVIVLVQMLRRHEWDLRAVAPISLLIAAYAVQSVLIGLRWGYGLMTFMPVQAVLATSIAGLAWVGFRRLTVEDPPPLLRDGWPHALPAVAVALLLAFWPDPVGPVIMAAFLGYGGALLWLSRGGPDMLVASRLDGSTVSYRSLQVTGLALVGSALTDLLISFDLIANGGARSGAMVAVGNVATLLVLGWVASVAGTAQVGEEAGEAPPDRRVTEATDADEIVVERVGDLMREGLYKESELNLRRIARRLNLPARRVSQAVNRVCRKSVSQYVNDYRVAEACRLLETTQGSITHAMFEAGFLSKSNFNREFLRVMGESPTIWRDRCRRSRGPRRVSAAKAASSAP